MTYLEDGSLDPIDQDALDATRSTRTTWRDRCPYASPLQQKRGMCAAGGMAWGCNPEAHRDYWEGIILSAPLAMAFDLTYPPRSIRRKVA